MPTELLNKTFHELMDVHGYVYLCNAPDDFDPVGFCRGLGPFIPNYTGAVVGDVRPEAGMDDVYHAGNTRPLMPHTEGYDFEIVPPRFIALWCVTPCRGEGGETTLMDARAFVQTLSDEERDHLNNHVYDWKTTDGIRRMGLDLHTRHPVLEDHADGQIVRFSCNNLIRADDDPAAAIQEKVKRYFDQHHIAVNYERNDMLVWDNWRMLHSRTAFNDRHRHLRRIQVGTVITDAPSEPPARELVTA
ncbi:TauD/TfdA family dioxygenase [Plantactinospora sp. KBS50]|uniref:TauD/TfdA family dioxygenase n=1 Tax=Plantactinospora sp. KBS50 TaxID=2024580 RepID=UPI0018DF9987|nr:TauD/TfdA family dioxygenase [Plantactinospora sp. KBS50]